MAGTDYHQAHNNRRMKMSDKPHAPNNVVYLKPKPKGYVHWFSYTMRYSL